jgi:hypothetical protein
VYSDRSLTMFRWIVVPPSTGYYSTFKMVVEGSFEMPVKFDQTTRRHILEYSNLQDTNQ